MAATRQAEVIAGNLHPLEVLWGREHAVEQLAVAGLELCLLAKRPPCILYSRRESIADRLQLTEIKRTWLPRESRNVGGYLQAGEGLRDQGRELSLKTADLTAQLNAGEALVAAHPQRIGAVSFEQMGHTRLRV